MSAAATGSVGHQSTGTVGARMMLSDEYSDLTFICKGEFFKVHKVVVCSQSSVIRAIVKSDLEVSINRVLFIREFTPEFVRRFVQFLYTNDYDATNIYDEKPQPANSAETDEISIAEGDSTATGDRTTAKVALPSASNEISSLAARDPVFGTILAHTRMIAMGDYYDVPDLITLANMRIKTTLSSACPNAPWIAGLPAIAEAALDIVNNEGLSEIFTTAVSENISTILTMGTLEDSPLMTPFSLELLKKCNATSQALSETLSTQTRTLNEVRAKYQKAVDARYFWGS